MKRKSFTLIEILIALIILSILASLSVAVYQKTVDANNERICAQNLKVLQAAIDIYTVENDALPAALSLLTPRQIYLAYSRVIGERRENRLSIALRKMFSTEPALAQTQGEIFKRRYLSGDIKAFRDPADTTPTDPTPGCLSCGSYKVNFTDGQTVDLVKKRLIATSTFAIVYDDDSEAPRHKGKLGNVANVAYRLGVTPGGRVGKMETGGYITQFLEPLGES